MWRWLDGSRYPRNARAVVVMLDALEQRKRVPRRRRETMKGHIQRRGKDTWPIIYDLPPGRDGKRRQRSVTVHGPKRDAQVKLREIPTSLDTGDHVEPTKETLSSYLERWLDSYAATATSLRTQRDYRGIIHGYLIPILGGIPFEIAAARPCSGPPPRTFYPWIGPENSPPCPPSPGRCLEQGGQMAPTNSKRMLYG